MATAITFSRQNEAGSRVSSTQYWENLVLVVVLVSESKVLLSVLIGGKMSCSNTPRGNDLKKLFHKRF